MPGVEPELAGACPDRRRPRSPPPAEAMRWFRHDPSVWRKAAARRSARPTSPSTGCSPERLTAARLATAGSPGRPPTKARRLGRERVFVVDRSAAPALLPARRDRMDGVDRRRQAGRPIVAALHQPATGGRDRLLRGWCSLRRPNRLMVSDRHPARRRCLGAPYKYPGTTRSPNRTSPRSGRCRRWRSGSRGRQTANSSP